MSVEQVKKFLEEVAASEELQAKIAALSKDNMETAITQGIAIAKEYGYECTPEDWHKFNCANEERPLDDDELDAVACGGETKPEDTGTNICKI